MWPKINGNGGPKFNQARRLKELEQETALLCRVGPALGQAKPERLRRDIGKPRASSLIRASCAIGVFGDRTSCLPFVWSNEIDPALQPDHP